MSYRWRKCQAINNDSIEMCAKSKYENNNQKNIAKINGHQAQPKIIESLMKSERATPKLSEIKGNGASSRYIKERNINAIKEI